MEKRNMQQPKEKRTESGIDKIGGYSLQKGIWWHLVVMDAGECV